jgi:hypothetical protein
MFTNSELEVFSPGNYICEICELNYSKFKPIFTHNRGYVEHSYTSYDNSDKIMYTNKMYLAINLLTDESYWATLNVGNSGIYFKLVCKINIKNGLFQTSYEPKCIMICEYNFKGYSIYTTSLPLYRIPSSYKIIPNNKKKWNELCELVIKYKINVPISWIIIVSDLRRFIYEFF